MKLKRKFRNELPKLLMLVSFGLVLTIGILSQLSVEVILFRTAVGTVGFGIIGFLVGIVIDHEQERNLVQGEREKIKQQVKQSYNEAVATKNEEDVNFEPFEIENLAKIVVESLKD